MRNIVIAAALAAAVVGAQAADEAWFGAKIPGSGEKPVRRTFSTHMFT